MRSLGIFATLALAVVSYAAPRPLSSAVETQTPSLLTELSSVETRDVGLHARDGCGCKSLPDIMEGITVELTSLVNELNVLTPANCTIENITLIVNDMKGIISGAIVDTKALIGLSLSEVLKTTNGVMSLLDLCHLIATLYVSIFSCFSVVLKIVVSVDYNGVCGLFAEVGVLLATLLQLIISISGSILIIIVPLLKVCLSVVVEIGCSSSFSYLL
ncbi:hypothetical protein K435DRAFT_963369 [Dendrothele bispora CBS 962.96]|uniref:Hydrophobin n=1 Tax=Dendrothele bispora (strain CBS 962.96) TaxID=1314807 RepID=A0A4S8MH48_DENBC|nr:hypothetical protein K435DRAFT_963369 [Dendrothele bispora CBS 962.96]